METPETAPAQAAGGPTSAPSLSADDRLILMLAGIIAAAMVRDFADKEFQGMRSPRYESVMHRSLAVARSLLKRHRDWLQQSGH